MAKILLVDDDERVSNELAHVLRGENYLVETCNSGADALQLLGNYQYDLVVLDQNMPKMSGLEVCKQFRQSGGLTPIFFLSGEITPSTKESAFDFGGDDYIVKPFESREFLARLRALFRKSSAAPAGKMHHDGLELDSNLRTITCNSEMIQLTATEANVIEFFFRHPDKFFSAKQILDGVWASEAGAGEEAVRVLMHGLRKKFASRNWALPIITVKGSGYILANKER